MASIDNLVFSEADLVASISRESFYDFLREFWETFVPEPPVWNWHIELMCNEVQDVMERVFAGQTKKHDLIFNLPPGQSKSSIVSVALGPWAWTRMPSCRGIHGSFAYPLAMDLSRKSRDIIQSDKYRRCFPNIALRDDQNTKGYFANTDGGIRYAVGVGGAVTGIHGHYISIDDPMNPQQASSEADLKRANAWMSETIPSRKIDKSVTPIILTQQRLHQDDSTGHRLSKTSAGPVRHICLPAELGDNVQPAYLRKRYIDGLLDPVRLPRHVLEAALAELGEYGFASQFDQSPIPRGGAMFKTERIDIDTPPVERLLSQTVRYWDKAGTPKGGAYTVGLKMAVQIVGSLPHYWILDVVRGQWDSSVREEVILQTAEMDGRSVIVGVEQEPGSGGKESAEGTARRLSGFTVRIDRPTGDKITRADPASTQVNAGAVSLAMGDWNKSFIDELRWFPHGKYKDQVDAFSGAFAMLARPRIRVGAL
jgi:predicted phage terminase large subunit-like protein